MSKNSLLMRIVINPKVMAGKPVIRGTRLTVQYILKLLANGWSFGDIKKEYEGIADQDISACILYASEVLDNTEFLPFRGKFPTWYLVSAALTSRDLVPGRKTVFSYLVPSIRQPQPLSD